MEISKFFKDDYSNSALYTSFSKLASFVDGFKPSSRKVFFTVDKKNVEHNYKVANLAADTSSLTEYIHGAANLEGVIVGMAQSFSNNYPLLTEEGSFGDRLNHSAAASRYIFTKKSKWFNQFFNEIDKQIIKYREFEGTSIEPFFYVPILPLILLNGSTGIGNGYAQKILPRKKEDIINAMLLISEGQKPKNIVPYFEGFNGSVIQLEDGKVEIKGKIKNEGTTIWIEEVPFGYELNFYVKELDKLVEKGIIKDYKDYSEDGKFKFEIKCTREFGKQDEYSILDQLKLIDRHTENFTCVSENDSIIEFNNEIELLVEFFQIRTQYYIKRKVYLISKYEEEILYLKNKIMFIEKVGNDFIVLYKKSKKEIEDQLINLKFDKYNSSYEYLLEMRIDSFSQEKLKKLQLLLSTKQDDLKELSNKTPIEMFKDDIKGSQI